MLRNSWIEPGARVDAVLRAATTRLAEAGVEEPRRDAVVLLNHATGLTREQVLRDPDQTLPAASCAAFAEAIARRCGREPVSRIVGSREFWSLSFELGPDTLDPRPDSEVLVEAAAAFAAEHGRATDALDLGTGTGCLLLALLHERPGLHGVGIDRSAGAVEVARRNASRLGLASRAAFAVGDWTDAIADRAVDIILTNPPYIEREQIERLSPEVGANDPRLALDGGLDGLDAYRALAVDLARVIRPGGRAFIEIGAGQADAVRHVLDAHGVKTLEIRRDLAGHDRCLVATPAAPKTHRATV